METAFMDINRKCVNLETRIVIMIMACFENDYELWDCSREIVPIW